MRGRSDATQLIARPVWENPRVQLLDDIWLVTIVAILVATGVPWFVSGFQVDAGMASWGLLGLGGVHVAFTLLGSPGRMDGRSGNGSLTLLDLCGIALIAFIWLHVGGLQNPLFLTVFVLPVVGSIFLSRWHPYLLAAASVLAAAVVAFIQVPELRWFTSGFVGGSWGTRLLGGQGAVSQANFAGFYAPLGFDLVLLEVFGILLFACAAAAEYIGTIFDRLNANIALARTDADLGQRMWADLIEQLPAPALLVDPFTMRIASCSRLAIAFLQSGELPLEGRGLIEALQPSFPDIIQSLINGGDPEASAIVIRAGDQMRVTRMRVLQLAHKDRRLALLTIEDATEVLCLKAALDASEYASLVIDSRGCVIAFNKPAVGLFGAVQAGTEARLLLSQPAPTERWWDPGITARRKMHMQIGSRIYQLTSSAIALPGEEERLFTAAFLPVGNVGGLDPSASSTTLVTPMLGKLA